MSSCWAKRALLTLLLLVATLVFGSPSRAQSGMKGLIEALEAIEAKRQMETNLGRLSKTFGPSDGFSVADIAWCGDNNTLVSSGGLDKSVLIWDVKQGKVLRSIERMSGSRAIACDRQARFIASGSGNGFRVWDITHEDMARDVSGPFILTPESEAVVAGDLSFSPDGRYLFVQWRHYNKKTFRIALQLVAYDVNNLKVILDIPLQDKSIAAWLRISPVLGKRLSVYAYAHGDSGGPFVSVINAVKKKEIIEFRANGMEPTALAFGRNDETLFVAGQYLSSSRPFGKGVHIITESSITERKYLRTIVTGHTEKIGTIVYRDDLDLLVTASGDKTMELRKASTGELIDTLGDRKNPVYSIAVRDDGRQLLSAAGRVINVWPLTPSEP